LDFNQRLTRAYPELFSERIEGEGNSEPTTPEEIYQANWGHYDQVYCLAQGDIRRFDEVTALQVHTCYMYLANDIEKRKLEQRMINKQNNI